MTPQEDFDLRGSVVAILYSDHSGRRSAAPGKIEKIGIRRNDCKAVIAREVPNRLVRCVSRQASIEDMNRSSEKIIQPASQLGREVCVEEQLQRAIRSRPACEAYA